MHISVRQALLGICIILFAVVCAERSMGRVFVYQHGPVALWSSDVQSDQNSQQAFDAYSFSHVIHGFAFYGVLAITPVPLTIGAMAVVAVGIEAWWETLENTDLIIDRYRDGTSSTNYRGDSILNSICDILSMIVGFYLAYKLSWQWTILLLILIEVVLLITIHDNLTLNIIMLLHPIPAIRQWQMAL